MSTIPKPGASVGGCRSGSPIMALLDLLGRRWSMGVLWTLCEAGHLPFGGLRNLCDTISPGVLSQRLKELQQAMLLIYVNGGYAPTDLGIRLYRELVPLGRTAWVWDHHIRGDTVNVFRPVVVGGNGATPELTDEGAREIGGSVAESWALREERVEEALWVPYRSTLIRLPVHAMFRMDAERDYVRIHDAERSYLLRATMSDICDRLGDRFLRIHRSSAVARDRVVALRHTGGGSWSAVDPDGREIAIGRTYLQIVREALKIGHYADCRSGQSLAA